MAHLPPGPWHEFPELWDRCILGDYELPGLAKVEVLRQNKWDTKKSKGSHGGERQFGGVDLAKVRIEVRFWTAEQWSSWFTDGFFILEPGPKDPSVKDAIAISHVVTDARKVFAITIDAIDGPSVDGGIGVIEIEATEYREPDKNNANGKAGGAGGNCAGLAAQRALEESQVIVWQGLQNSYLLLSNFDPQKAGEAGLEVIKHQQQVDLIRQQQIAAGCIAVRTDPTDQEAAEALL